MSHELGIVLPVIVGAFVLLVVGITIKRMWRNPEPNQALIISGRKGADEGVYRVVVGHGAFVAPFISQVREIDLSVRTAALAVRCQTKQGIPVVVKGTVMFKVGSTPQLVTNAAQRFLDQQQGMVELTVNTFDGHLRTIVGGLDMEELLRNRQQLVQEVRDACTTEMNILGLVVDSLQISDLEDPTGFFENLAAPQVSRVKSAARVAAAAANQAAAEAESAAAAKVADAQRQTSVAQAKYKAEVDKAQAESAQAGPLAAALAQKAVTAAATEAAELQAHLRQQQLVAETIKPAEAEAEAARLRAQGKKDADIAAAVAEAERERLMGVAEAEAIAAKATALAQGGDGVVFQRFIELLPELVKAAADPLAQVDHLTVLDGAGGLTGIPAELVASVISLFPSLRGKINLLGSGTTPAAAEASLVATSSDGHAG